MKPSVDEDEESKTPLAVNVQKATKFFGDPRLEIGHLVFHEIKFHF